MKRPVPSTYGKWCLGLGRKSVAIAREDEEKELLFKIPFLARNAWWGDEISHGLGMHAWA